MSVKSLTRIEGYFMPFLQQKTRQELRFTSVISTVKYPKIERNIAHRKCRQIYWRLETLSGSENIIMPFPIFSRLSSTTLQSSFAT